jgi:hypothetical protein
MLVYPQLGTGALGQFPIRKQQRARTVVNAAADGSSFKLADPAGTTTEWTLAYACLTDGEKAALEQFFAAAEGTLNGFTFLDPTANLLSWSGKLDEAVWARDPLVSVAVGMADPAGGSGAWRMANPGAAAQAISQTLAAPGGYLYCVSAYVRAEAASTATMLLGNSRGEQAVQTQWRRIAFAGNGDATAESIRFGLEIPAGATVDVFGIQVEPQSGASVYRASTTGGVYENARLRDDELSITTTGPNYHSCTVNIIHVNHI